MDDSKTLIWYVIKGQERFGLHGLGPEKILPCHEGDWEVKTALRSYTVLAGPLNKRDAFEMAASLEAVKEVTEV